MKAHQPATSAGGATVASAASEPPPAGGAEPSAADASAADAPAPFEIACSASGQASLEEELMAKQHPYLEAYTRRAGWRTRTNSLSTKLEARVYGTSMAEDTLDALFAQLLRTTEPWICARMDAALSKIPKKLRGPSGLLEILSDWYAPSARSPRKAVPLLRELLQHVTSNSRHGAAEPMARRVASKLAEVLTSLGEHAEAEGAWRASLATCEDLEDDAPDKIESRVRLGECLLKQGAAKRNEARLVIGEAIVAKQRSMGKPESEVMGAVHEVMNSIDELDASDRRNLRQGEALEMVNRNGKAARGEANEEAKDEAKDKEGGYSSGGSDAEARPVGGWPAGTVGTAA